MKTRNPLWLVTWIDAVGTNSWEGRQGAIDGARLLECQVIGRLIRVTRTDILIAGGWSYDNDNVTTLHVIPRVNIVRWQRLTVGRPTKRVASETRA